MSNLQTITDSASESIEGLDGLLDSPASSSGERQFGRPSGDDPAGQVAVSSTGPKSSSPRTATSPNVRRGRFTDVHNVSAAVPAPALLCRPT